MTCPSPDARITPGCPGLWNDAQRDGLEAHRRLRARQHATRRSRCSSATPAPRARRACRGRARTCRSPTGNWPLDLGLAAAVPRRRQRLVAGDDARRHGPRARRLRRARRAARPRPASTGSSCTARTATCCRRSSRRSPTSAPTSTAARSTTACAIRSRSSRAMRAVWPERLPMSVRISAHDWVEGGITPDDAVEIARAFKAAGADLIDCSSGQVSKQAEAGLRPHVPDAVRRPHPQRGRHRDHRRRRDLRGRPRQQHHRRRPRRPVRDRAAAPRQPGVDAARGGQDRLHRRARGRSSTARPRRQLERNLERERAMAAQGARRCRRSSRRTGRWASERAACDEEPDERSIARPARATPTSSATRRAPAAATTRCSGSGCACSPAPRRSRPRSAPAARALRHLAGALRLHGAARPLRRTA